MLDRVRSFARRCRGFFDRMAFAPTMTITQEDLGHRLWQGRARKRLSLEDAAKKVHVAARDLDAIERGERKVSTREFDAFVRVYGGDHKDYFAVEFPVAVQSMERALFRAPAGRMNAGTHEALSKAVRLYYQLGDLVSFTGGDERPMPPDMSMPAPRSLAIAIRQGRDAAVAVRHRLGLGIEPLGDVWDLIEREGVDIGLLELPDDISGLMLARSGRRPFILLAIGEHVDRRSFSLAHEYAHVLLDRAEGATVSPRGEDVSLIEKRANAFASELLVPSDAVRAHLATASGAVAAEDVVALAQRFGVSRQVVLMQLERLKFIGRTRRDRLDAEAGGLNGRSDFDHAGARKRFLKRYTGLARQARAAGEISKDKLLEVLALVADAGPPGAMQQGKRRR